MFPEFTSDVSSQFGLVDLGVLEDTKEEKFSVVGDLQVPDLGR